MKLCFYALLCIFLVSLVHVCDGAKSGKELIENLVDFKEWKKLLRTKTNVLVLFAKSPKDVQKQLKICREVADEVKGQGTLLFIDCGGEGKKLCKKLKMSPAPLLLKHYKDGEYHKDYDRLETVSSMVNFMRDPTGDQPWEEDETATDVVHVKDPQMLAKLVKGPSVLVMFYAPWCGFCKRMKPAYAAAATQLKPDRAKLGALDATRPENSMLRHQFNITGFPTLLYFEKGAMKFQYEGENTQDALVAFMRNPMEPPKKKEEPQWSDTPSEVVHLTDATFSDFIKAESSVLIMFYAPWCGHCKKMKPEYTAAAASIKEKQIRGKLAAVDATKATDTAALHEIKGYPTVKYFKDGEFAFNVNFRTEKEIVEFMKDPKEPPPPPPPEKPWSDVESAVVHLDESNFKTFLKKKKHVLVMFYAPWCGHCKAAKPEFQAAADKFADDPKVEYAAVDCTQHQSVCNQYDVKGFPTIKYFSYLNKDVKDYTGGRKEADFVSFMSSPGATVSPPAPDPKALWSSHAGAEFVVHLSDTSFDAFAKQQPILLVMFYAPWCGYCKRMIPSFSMAAERLQDDGHVAKLAAVDATAERKLAEAHGVKSYPTIKLYHYGKFKELYSGERDTSSIVTYLTREPKTEL